MELQKYYCFPIDYELALDSYFNKENFYYGELEINLCLDSNNCMSKEEFLGYITLGLLKDTLIINTLVANTIIDPLERNQNV